MSLLDCPLNLLLGTIHKMNIKQLLNSYPNILEIHGSNNQIISSIILDSRQVIENSLFVAIKGITVDGHSYIHQAIDKGAKFIVLEDMPTTLKDGVVYIKVVDSAIALGEIASVYYNNPSGKLHLIGITGTNGKTTTATLLFDLFTKLGYKCGLISTIVNKIGDKTLAANYTTPDAAKIQQLLHEMHSNGCSHVFMEVSSHAVHQKRIAGLTFKGGIFTNISHDHLDYHGTFLEYINVKKAFFDSLPKTAFAITNVDDKRGNYMLQNTQAATYTYGFKHMAYFKGKVIENALTGLYLSFSNTPFFSRLIGQFNAYNLLAVFGTAILLEEEELEILPILSSLEAAAGRFDHIYNESSKIIGIVDYAHTPDALENVLSTISQLKPQTADLITVVGCGGNRDKAKRPKMAQIACDLSQQVILTSDNPRNELPEAIIEEMEQGIPPSEKNKVLSIVNRKEAIKTATKIAKNGDVILVAGKGHEKYQEIQGVKTPFDDKEILTQALESK